MWLLFAEPLRHPCVHSLIRRALSVSKQLLLLRCGCGDIMCAALLALSDFKCSSVEFFDRALFSQGLEC